MPLECYKEILEKAEPDDIWQGKVWYAKVSQECVKLATETGYTLEQCAGVVAVLSPMVEWTLNLRSARKFIKAKGKVTSTPGFYRNKKKAQEILRGNLGVIRGPKVKAFFETLVNPNYEEPVIDTQMIAAFYKGIAYRDDFKWVNKSKKRLEPIRKAVKILAKEKAWKVSETQAIIWITFKRLNGPYANQLKLWR